MAELEKLTINLNPVDLGQIELLISQGFYANRAEFIRIAIHNQLAKHTDSVREVTTRKEMVIGAVILGKRDLERAQANGDRLALKVVGLLALRDDVSPDLASKVIESIEYHGVFKAPELVKQALKDRIRN